LKHLVVPNRNFIILFYITENILILTSMEKISQSPSQFKDTMNDALELLHANIQFMCPMSSLKELFSS